MFASQERWLLLPQAPSAELSALDPSRARRDDGSGGGLLVDRGLLVRLATKEDVLDDEPMAAAVRGLLDAAALESEVSVERAAASARLCYD